jgi:hypothetical protein
MNADEDVPGARRGAGGMAHALALLAGVACIALCFAQVEIQIEGGRGWAAGLPTWRIEKHPLLDLFWGGRPLTGYHVWVFGFMFLVFHLPHLVAGRWSPRIEARCLGSLMLFWIIEDLAWFLMNPAFRMADFNPAGVPWHIHWLFGVPTDYVTFTAAGFVLLAWSFVSPRPAARTIFK